MKQIKKILGLVIVFIIAFFYTLSPVFALNKINFQKPVVGEISQAFYWYHPAVDIAGNEDAKVYPIADGKVIEVGYQFRGYGKYVAAQHDEKITSMYAHLKVVNAKTNQEVGKDSILGIVGSTGRSTGPHLHLEIEIGGEKINPLSVIEDL